MIGKLLFLRKRVIDLLLSVDGEPATVSLNDLRFSLKSGASELNKEPSLTSVLAAVSGLVDDGRDPYVSLQFGAGVSLQALHDLCALLSSVDTEKGMRIEPPRPGQLFYKAFAPASTFLDRESRMAQPWELRLVSKESGVTAILTRIEETWKAGQPRPDLKPINYEVATPEALKQALQQYGPGLPVILVIAQPRITHGQLMTFLAPVLPIHSTIHVFLKE